MQDFLVMALTAAPLATAPAQLLPVPALTVETDSHDRLAAGIGPALLLDAPAGLGLINLPHR